MAPAGAACAQHICKADSAWRRSARQRPQAHVARRNAAAGWPRRRRTRSAVRRGVVRRRPRVTLREGPPRSARVCPRRAELAFACPGGSGRHGQAEGHVARSRLDGAATTRSGAAEDGGVAKQLTWHRGNRHVRRAAAGTTLTTPRTQPGPQPGARQERHAPLLAVRARGAARVCTAPRAAWRHAPPPLTSRALAGRLWQQPATLRQPRCCCRRACRRCRACRVRAARCRPRARPGCAAGGRDDKTRPGLAAASRGLRADCHSHWPGRPCAGHITPPTGRLCAEDGMGAAEDAAALNGMCEEERRWTQARMRSARSRASHAVAAGATRGSWFGSVRAHARRRRVLATAGARPHPQRVAQCVALSAMFPRRLLRRSERPRPVQARAVRQLLRTAAVRCHGGPRWTRCVTCCWRHGREGTCDCASALRARCAVCCARAQRRAAAQPSCTRAFGGRLPRVRCARWCAGGRELCDACACAAGLCGCACARNALVPAALLRAGAALRVLRLGKQAHLCCLRQPRAASGAAQSPFKGVFRPTHGALTAPFVAALPRRHRRATAAGVHTSGAHSSVRSACAAVSRAARTPRHKRGAKRRTFVSSKMRAPPFSSAAFCPLPAAGAELPVVTDGVTLLLRGRAQGAVAERRRALC
jgi:hypothetical protein